MPHSNSTHFLPRRRGLFMLLTVPGLVLLGTSVSWAQDGPDGLTTEDQEEPETWSMTQEELEAIGLGQYRGDPIPVPEAFPLRYPEGEPVPQKRGVMFINFDGARLTSGRDDSTNNVTQISQIAQSCGNYQAYGGTDSQRQAVVQAVQSDWSPYNVTVTDERPSSGDYTMNMTGPCNAYGGGVLGIAPLDCQDRQTHNNITYAFHSASDRHSAAIQATTIGQEVAHSYGLEHVDEPGDIMNPQNAGGDPDFNDKCIPIVTNGQGIACGSQHSAECGTSSQQNSHQELLTLFGPSDGTVDTTPPMVDITSPNDGAVFDESDSFSIDATASDDQALGTLTLYQDGSQVGTDSNAPFSWQVDQPPAGEYEFYVMAQDLAGNEAMSNVINITVEAGGGGGGGTDPDPGDTGDDTGTDDDGSDPGGGGSDPGDGDGDSGGGDGDDGGTGGGSDGGGDDGGADDGGADDGGADDGGADGGGTGGGLPPGYGGGYGDSEDRNVGCSVHPTGGLPLWSLILSISALGFVRRRNT